MRYDVARLEKCGLLKESSGGSSNRKGIDVDSKENVPGENGGSAILRATGVPECRESNCPLQEDCMMD